MYISNRLVELSTTIALRAQGVNPLSYNVNQGKQFNHVVRQAHSCLEHAIWIKASTSPADNTQCE